MADEENKTDHSELVEKQKAERLEKIQAELLKGKFLGEKEFKENFDWENKDQIGQHSQDGAKQVYKIKNLKTGDLKAIKIWTKLEDMNPREIQAMINLHTKYYHSNIVNYENLYTWEEENEEGSKIHVIVATMEYYPETLETLIAKNPNGVNDIESAWLMQQALSVITYLKEGFNTSLFNIKPGNILVSKTGNFAFSDFGANQINENEGLSQAQAKLEGCQASIYMSPELYNGVKMNKQSVNMSYEKVDIFALGICLLQYTSGKLPEDKPAPISRKQCAPICAKMGPFWKKIIPPMIEEDFEKRSKAQDVLNLCNTLARMEESKKKIV